jgi:hypothetical protein
MQHVRRIAVAAAAISALAMVPCARAADPAPAGATAQARIPSRDPLPMTTLAPGIQFDGIWMFDAAHSDDPMKVMQAARPQRGPGGEGGMGMFGGGRRGGGPEGGGGRGGPGGPGGPGGMGPGGEGDAVGDHPDQPAENRPRGPSPMARIMRPAKKVIIEMQSDQLNVTEDEAAPRPYALADSLKAHNRELLTENTEARWKSGGLELTQTLGPRGKLVETYELSHDGKTLTIRARREGGREGMPNPVITRVYTRYDGE